MLPVEFDPDAEWTKSVVQHHMDVDYSPYEGKQVKGRVETVLLRGNVIVDNDEYFGNNPLKSAAVTVAAAFISIPASCR